MRRCAAPTPLSPIPPMSRSKRPSQARRSSSRRPARRRLWAGPTCPSSNLRLIRTGKPGWRTWPIRSFRSKSSGQERRGACSSRPKRRRSSSPMSRAIAFVTTCSRDGWGEYGQRFAESFLKRFPPQARLYFYIDFKAPLRNERVVFRSIPNDCRKLLEFQDGLGRFPFARGRVVVRSSHEVAHNPSLLWNAFKFSFKMFCVQHAVATGREDAIVWIDADTFAFAEIPWSVIEETVPADCMVSYLGR